MLGFTAISESAISDVLSGVVLTPAVGTVNAGAVVAGVGKMTGIVGAAGRAVGSALVQGLTFKSGKAPASRNQLFDFSVDVMQALLWQYDTADALPAIIASKQKWYTDNQQFFWENWFINVFDLRTANDFGCSVWAIILGIPLDRKSVV